MAALGPTCLQCLDSLVAYGGNEWCEGTYLEPDGKFGRMFLEQTGEAIRTVREAIDLTGSTPESVTVMAELLKMMQGKMKAHFA